jgi:hypothetical protein
MTAVSGHQYSVGFRQARAYALDSRGIIDPSGTALPATAYNGLQFPSVKNFDLTIPDIRRIVHVGDDHVNAQDVLPRIEASSGAIKVGRNDHDLYALLTGTKVATVDEKTGIGYATDEQGNEIDIALMAWQQSLDASTKVRHYRSYMFATTRVIAVPGGMSDAPAEFTFSLIPQTCARTLWGIPLSTATNGYLEAEFQEYMTVGYPHVAAWRCDGTETTFNFHASYQANSVTKVTAVLVAAAGTYAAASPGVITTAHIIPTTKPSNGDVLIAFYEYTP